MMWSASCNVTFPARTRQLGPILFALWRSQSWADSVESRNKMRLRTSEAAFAQTRLTAENRRRSK